MNAQRTGTGESPFGYCLNTSTIKGQELPIEEEIDIAAQAGYDGIEPWVSELDAYTAAGGDLRNLRVRLADAGLTVPNLIGFFNWLSEDATERQAGLAEARRCLGLAAQLGAKQLAAPPMGMVDKPGLDLARAAQSYGELLDMAEGSGVVPMVEFWGVSKSLGRLGEALFIAVESGRENACVLADVFHMYKGGSPHAGLRLLGGNALGLLHMNDYPASPARADIRDADRVYPGDGIAPLEQILRDLADAGYRGMLSLELFNASYWQQDALTVAQTGIGKMKKAVAAALA